MPFQPGNKHGSREKPRVFDGALRRAIAQDSADRVRKAAEKLLDCAAEGQPWAINALADRLDGKAHQSVSVEPTDARSMTLDELTARLAGIVEGGTGEDEGSGVSGGLH